MLGMKCFWVLTLSSRHGADLPGLITSMPHIVWMHFHLLSLKVQLDVFLVPPASLLQCVRTSTAA